MMLGVYAVAIFSTSFMSLSYRRIQQQQDLIENNHPLANRGRYLLRALKHHVGSPDTTTSKKLRYLAIVSSKTARETAYPFLLDPEVHSLSVTSMDLAAACSQSIVGTGDFNFITVEYIQFSESHAILIRRLRQRFPEALIVLIANLVPDMQLVLENGNHMIPFRDWKIEHQNRSVVDLARSMIETSQQWSFINSSPQQIEELLQLDPLLFHYQLPIPVDLSDLSEFLQYYNSDLTKLLDIGNEKIAIDLQNIVKQKKFQPQPGAMGSWGSGDQCQIWYVTGDFALESTGRKVNLPTFFGLHKHALEFSRVKSSAKNTVVVDNPFASDRLLSLTYLTDANSMHYPRSRVIINGRATVVLQPFHNGSSRQHFARTTGVGYVPPGRSTIYLDPLQSTTYPFRLLGASILAEEVQNLQSIEFALEPEALNSDDDVLLDTTSSSRVFSSLFR
jgi:hypothetical protein